MPKPTNPNFYTVIIGTEILNGRREDKHFAFVRDKLLQRGYKLKASFVIEDDPKLIENVFSLIKQDPNSVMLSFGGIGATPDDYTRAIAAKVFGDGQLYMHEEAKKRILERFKEAAYPHRINMAMLPKDAKLLHNPINNVPGFYVEDRFFFVPGFPQMSHPMIEEALKLFPPKKLYRYTICVEASENDLLDIMKQIPKDVEFSSLPAIKGSKYRDTISIASEDKEKAKKWIEFFIDEVEKRGFYYTKEDGCL